ncbi:F-box family protein [Actinidia rufa]|uniref:F-box family protein n=1 Tax=Actinidia rufa TaxID=165716 RepID=A0A7J0FQ55_9ERIC|nr:F-box family protein [Actinidia rufa]
MEKTWPGRSDGCRFNSLPLVNPHNFTDPLDLPPKTNAFKNFYARHNRFSLRSSPSSSAAAESRGDFFSAFRTTCWPKSRRLSFSLPNLRAASLVCKAWRDALQPLREAMLFLRWGKRFKHGRGGVRANLHKALDSFLKGAARGSTLSMVDAGLVYWEMGKKEEGMELYRRAAALGDPAGQCNLGISCLKGEIS